MDRKVKLSTTEGWRGGKGRRGSKGWKGRRDGRGPGAGTLENWNS
jgi:hypothetical protein